MPVITDLQVVYVCYLYHFHFIADLELIPLSNLRDHFLFLFVTMPLYRGADINSFVINHFYCCPVFPVSHRIPDTYLPVVRGEYLCTVSTQITIIS